jgi:hypothetical protein
MTTPQQLQEKWAPVLNHSDLPEIKDSYRRQVTAVLLENQEKAMQEQAMQLNEAAPTNVTGNVAKYDPVLIGLVRRAMPQLLAYDLCGVQPMSLPTGLVFAMKSRYKDNADLSLATEALYNEANAGYSGHGGVQNGASPVQGDDNGLDPWATNPPGNFSAGGSNTAAGVNGGVMTTTAAEGVTPAEMGFTIEKHTVTAGSRALKAEYSIELAQDLKAVHGLDAESELSNILSQEITAEINREVIRSIYKIARPGAFYGTSTQGTFDLDVDANGRWSVERFKGMLFQIERDANRIAQITRRGRGNTILCSADVASALAMAGMLDYTPAISANLNVDEASTTYAGVLNGKYKVFIDPFMANGSVNQYYLVGYKGSSPYDAGMFYCPYVPLQMLRAVDPNTFQPKIGFKTRYGMIGNPLAGADADSDGNVGMQAGKNGYYSLTKVANLT